jgi:hypothetical protein
MFCRPSDMSKKRLSQRDMIEALALLAEHGTLTGAARTSYWDRGTIRYRIKQLQKQHPQTLTAEQVTEVNGYNRVVVVISDYGRSLLK